MKIKKIAKKAIKKFICTGEDLFSLLFPDVCPFCGRVLDKRASELICERCRFKLPHIYEPRCKKCGKPVEKEEQEYCMDCEQHKHYFERGFAVWEHQGAVARAIYQFKYHNRRIYSRPFAREMAKSYESYIYQWNIDLIVPIPISRKRRRKRGYNQAVLLARELRNITGIPYDEKCMIRIKDTVAQKKLDVRGRRANLRNVFEWKGEEHLIKGKNILLVDDIYTTGSTIDETSRILKKIGAKNVYFMTISIGQGY